ncbi:N-glycosylase [Candidatus Pacearchaeota archaeon]|nr:N-glycosylase [Candidatus Pacearchaeota archaeon]
MINQLITQINKLKDSEAAKTIDTRIKEFEQQGKKKEQDVFSELCFCLMTANFDAEKCIRIQKELDRAKGFEILPQDKLAQELKKSGHRFPNTRANYITQARSCSLELHNAIMKKDGQQMRNWLIENVKGLGMKEASHFLRNIGYKDVAIIDFHILDLLEKHNLIKKLDSGFNKSRQTPPQNRVGFQPKAESSGELLKPEESENLPIIKSKSLTKDKYLEIEKILKNLANQTNLNLAELDLYLWYLETGKILK